MAKKRVAAARTSKQSPTVSAPALDPLRNHPVLIELSKARAAWFLLAEIRETTTYTVDVTQEQADEAFEWLQSIGLRTLVEAHDDLEAAFRKSMVEGKAGAAA